MQLGDEWLRPTLLGLAFGEHNIDLASEIALEIATHPDALAKWKVGSTLDDLRRHVAQCRDLATQGALQAIAQRLEALCRK
jgi:hypothetical protein